MSASNLFAHAHRARRDERGFALPTALGLLAVALVTVSVGAVASVRVQSGSVRDQETKSALQIAEAGAQEALLHYNRIPVSSSNPCSPVTSSSPSGGWCGPMTGSLNDGSFSYYVRPTSGQLEVVSVGSDAQTTRRVHVTANSSSGQGIFSEATVKSQDSIQMDSNAHVNANMATNGGVNMNSNATVCGNISYGVGQTLTFNGNSGQTCGTNWQAPLTMPPVNQGDVVTNNDNGRFFALDPVSGNKADACWNGTKADGTSGACTERHLSITNNSSVTLGGSKYSFCKLTMSSNSAIYTQAGKAVVIYFDSPESCGYASGTTQLEMSSNSRITSTNGGPANMAMLFVGSTARATKILLNSNTSIGASCQQNFVVYAPRSEITLNSNSTFCGALGGKKLHIDSNSKVYTDSSAQDFVLPGTAPHYEVSRFVECGTAPASPPNAGC